MTSRAKTHLPLSVVAIASLVGISGGAALAHETLWTRRLVDLLGATGESISRTLGCFFLGLSLGAAWAAILARWTQRPLRTAAIAELGVALLCLPIATLPLWIEPLWPQLGMEGLLGPIGQLVKWGLSVGLVVPPAVAMGIVLPLVVTDVRERFPSNRDDSLWLYTINTAGGVLGLLTVTLILIPAIGAWWSMILAAALNLVVAASLFLLDRAREANRRTISCPVSFNEGVRRLRGPLAFRLSIGFFSGFCVLAVEVLAIRLVMLAAPLSYHSPAVVLATVIGCLAISSALVGWWSVSGRAHAVLATLLPIAAVGIVLAPWLFLTIASWWEVGPEPTLFVFLGKIAALVALSFGPVFLLCGCFFPLVFADDPSSQPSAGFYGQLLAVNGLGGWLGAEFASAVLLPTVGIHIGFGILATLTATVGVVVLLTEREKSSGSEKLATIGCLVLVLGATFGPLRELPVINPHLGFRVVDQRMERDGTVAVVEHESFGRALLVSNQYLLGSTRATADQQRQTHLPLVLHPEPESVAFIGIATGITPGAAILHEPVQKIVAIELSPAVVDLARHHFHEENLGLLDDPRTTVVIEDARTVLAAASGEFDVVIGDLILPWSPGEGRLYTREHFAAVRRSLKPGGLYCQWLPVYQLPPSQLQTIVKTFRSIFPRAELLRRELRVGTPALGLIGYSDDRTIDWETIEERCRAVAESRRVSDPSVLTVDTVAMLYLGAATTLDGGDVLNTLNNSCVEIEAGLQRVTGKPGSVYLVGTRWLETLGRYSWDWNGVPDQVRRRAAMGLNWSRSEGERNRSQLRADLARLDPTFEIPVELASNAAVNWELWPGDAVLIQQVVNKTRAKSEGIRQPLSLDSRP